MPTAKASLRTLAATAALLILTGASGQAASLRLCNGTRDAVEFALNTREKNGLSQTQGWWQASAGKCSEPVFRGKAGIYHLHVKKVRGSSIAFNAGDKFITVCAATANFTDRPHEHRADGKLKCAAHGLMSLKFMKFEMSRADLDDILILEPGGRVTVVNGTSPHLKTQLPDACKRFSNLC